MPSTDPAARAEPAPQFSAVPSGSLEQMLLEHLPLVERVTAWVCRRQGLGDDDADELGSRVRLKLIENDYGVLRRFECQSRIETYLTAVVINLARDLRIERWGKWRPSAAALRMGPEAVELETLVHRDGRSTDEAIETLRSRQRREGDVERLSCVVEALPARVTRRIEGPESLERVPAAETADRAVRDAEVREQLALAGMALERALVDLEVEDRLILQLRFVEGSTVAAIARSLGLDQRRLYRRLEKLVGRLRRSLERVEGLDPQRVLAAAGWSGAELEIDFQNPAFRGPRPSNPSATPPAEGAP